MGGLLVFSLLVAALSDAIASKVDAINAGTNPVLEANHVIVSGWTPRTLPLVRELLSSDHRRTIVVMGHLEKEAMDEELRDVLKEEMAAGAKVVTRTGDPLSLEDWERCAVNTAGAVVLVSPDHLSHQAADSQLMQASMALATLPDVKANLVTELRSTRNVGVLQSLLATLVRPKDLVETVPGPKRHAVAVCTGDLGLRVILDRALRPETVAVARELLHFDGHEFHVKEWPQLEGKTFGDALFLFKDAVPCGLLRSGASTAEMDPSRMKSPPFTPDMVSPDGLEVLISPPLDTTFQAGDKLLVIAEDEASYTLGPSLRPSPCIPETPQRRKAFFRRRAEFTKSSHGTVRRKRKVLVCGWTYGMLKSLRLLDSCLEKGSTVTILAPEFPVNAKKKLAEAMKGLSHFRLEMETGDTQDFSTLESFPLEDYDIVLVLAGEIRDVGPTASKGGEGGEGGDADFAEVADSSTDHISSSSTTAMLIRSIQKQRGRYDAEVVAELPALRGDVLSQLQSKYISRAVDVGLVEALVLAQFAEDPAVGSVLEEIVSGKGASFSLRSASQIAKEGERLSFWEMQERFVVSGRVLVAYKCQELGDQWSLNPTDKDRAVLVSSTDQFVVLG